MKCIQKHTIVILIILFFGISNLVAQVESSAYNLMLKSMLSRSVPEITVDSLEKISSPVVLLDAREMNEYDVSHIKNAKHVGYENFSINSLKSIPLDAGIIVYCAVGYRSEKIAEKLIATGYKNVFNLYGGIFEWKNQGNNVYNQSGKTNKIHAYSKAWGIWLNEGEKVYTK